ncbi:MAG TPA: hypothetical protein VKA07_09920 [Candidatus Sulfotelmatobacter sp.]|nr:hypothetical protein [Candidatus Sulfotelmatobacter sp.]
MPATRSLIDEILPDYDFGAAYETSVAAPASVVYQHLLVSDLYASWIVRLLVSLRYGRRTPRKRAPVGLRQRFQGSGFVILAETPGEELVIGVAGRFWRPDGGRRLDLSARDYVGFARSGDAKIALTFKLRPGQRQHTVLSTETRIRCFGRAAWWKFGLYWLLVRPFSGLIRKAILQHVKAEAEAAGAEDREHGGAGAGGRDASTAR